MMRSFGVFLQLFLALLTNQHSATCLKIGSFNIRTFGRSKMSKPDVVNILLQTVERYDLFLVMEIRDSTQTAIYDFLDQLNNRTENPYSLILSDRLGRSSYKEQYAFFYKESSGLSVSDVYHFDDGDENSGNDTFAREPYVVRFNSSQTGRHDGIVSGQLLGWIIQDFVLIPCHTAPDDAVLETDFLFDVYLDAVARWGIDDVMVLGDLNSDCSYVTSGEWDQIRLWTDPRFTWLVGNDADTTVSSTDCAYDRFVVAGDDFLNGINTSSVSVFNYRDAFNISQDLAYDVSDHWPIELDLYELNSEGTTIVQLSTTEGGASTENHLPTTPLPSTVETTQTQGKTVSSTEGGQSHPPTTPMPSTEDTTNTQRKTVSSTEIAATETSTEIAATENVQTTTEENAGVPANSAALLSTELWSGILAVSVVVSFLMGMLFIKAVTAYKKSTGRARSHDTHALGTIITNKTTR
ncbi:deoxyribonuclease-1-like [Branchiostoma floridae]|uniref:Deoxyribonuclease-1-like n=1 Tax=Branchiostoma floridae TaxID=7739 RepID=A0A9J7N0C6_BRAFL|nr:deoxyribonuclease-1-like [Branchiostoma floridae]